MNKRIKQTDKAVNKKLAHKQLHLAVLAQQKARTALGAAMNKRIKQTDKAVHKNAAQIKENAKAARKALEKAVHKFDNKLNNAKEVASKGRSKLAAQLAKQNKSIRQWAANKMKVIAAKTAAHFRRVQHEMAADRLHADMALKAASSKMTASFNAMTALNNKRFAKSVKDIKAARA